MKKNDKQRLFEVMGRLDKTFIPKLNEGIDDMEVDRMPDTGQAPDLQDMPAPEAMPDEEGVEEKSPEEKLADLTAKVDEMHAMLHGGDEEIEVATGEVDAENLQEWNFDKKKGEKEEGNKHEEKESAEFEKGEKEEEKEEVDEDVSINVTEKKGKALSAEKAPEVEIGK